MTIEHLYRAHNKTCFLYHLVTVVKYRRKLFTPEMEEALKNICSDIEDQTEFITFFQHPEQFRDELEKLMTLNFEIIKAF